MKHQTINKLGFFSLHCKNFHKLSMNLQGVPVCVLNVMTNGPVIQGRQHMSHCRHIVYMGTCLWCLRVCRSLPIQTVPRQWAYCCLHTCFPPAVLRSPDIKNLSMNHTTPQPFSATSKGRKGPLLVTCVMDPVRSIL